MRKKRLPMKGWYMWGVWDEKEKTFSDVFYQSKIEAVKAMKLWNTLYDSPYKVFALMVKPSRLKYK